MIDALARLIPDLLDLAIAAGPVFWIAFFAIVFSPCYLRTREH